jgi:hypothetical protein
MHKFRTTYLGAFIFGWLLALGTHVAWGYYPPLQATGSYSSHEVSYTVYNPQKQQGYTAYHNYPDTITVVNLQQHNGVIAWVTKDGASYSVECVTFDPVLNTFQNNWWGPFASVVSFFQVVDGVVAFSIIDSSGNIGARYATYDPAKEAWQKGVFSAEPGDFAVVSTGLYCKDGVVVYRYLSSDGGDIFKATLYEPQWGKWSAPIYFGSGSGFLSLYINNATIYFETKYWGPEMRGYFLGGWDNSPTVPVAYFVAQPDFGKKPLWVWFTDMSIAGANWNWNFGDSTPSVTSRSPYHSFASTGTFQVTQQISGPSTYSRTITVLNTFMLEGKSLPAMLHLLLLTD